MKRSPKKKKINVSISTLRRLTAAVRKIRILARASGDIPFAVVPASRPPLAVRKQVVTRAPAAVSQRVVVQSPTPPPPPSLPRVTDDRLRQYATALARTQETSQKDGVFIRPHVEALWSDHVLEVNRAVDVVQEPVRRRSRPSITARLWARTVGAVTLPADLRLNPHRKDIDRPEALSARARDHADIPSALARGVSEAAEGGLERMEGFLRSTVAAPFVAMGNRGERTQAVHHAAHMARIADDDFPGDADSKVSDTEPEVEEFDDPVADNEQPEEPEAETFLGAAWEPLRLAPSLAALGLLAVVVLGPIQVFASFTALHHTLAQLQGQGRDAVTAVAGVQRAAGNQDPVAAGAAFAAANSAFGAVRGTLGPVGNALIALATHLPTGSGVQAGAVLLSTGQELTVVGERMASALSNLPASAGPTDILFAIRETALSASPVVHSAAEQLTSISSEALPQEHRAEVEALVETAQTLAASFDALLPITDALLPFLGQNEARRYLLVFQNQNELRPTGGFIGSFAEITVERGRITDMRFPPGGSYDIQGDVRAWLNPPDPLRLVTSRWRFHDANWFPDFPTSARKLAWFYEKSGGPTVDGVIAVNATMLEEVLRVTGPVEMPDYDVTLTADNVLTKIQHAVELHPADSTKPKQILADLFPMVLARLESPTLEQTLALSEALSRGLGEKRVQLFARDPQVAGVFSEQGWDGAVKQTAGDYLALNIANIGGEKTDAVMQEAVKQDVEILADGRVRNTVTVSRTHTGTVGTPLTGVRNIAYMRLYVPAGSTLISASGDFNVPPQNLFVPKDPSYDDDPDVRAATVEREDIKSGVQVMQDGGKTVFAHWMQVLPGQTQTVRYVYELPKPISLPKSGVWATLTGQDARSAYTLLVQKQSGAEQRTYAVNVQLPDGLQLVHVTAPDADVQGKTVKIPSGREIGDHFIGILFAE